MLVTANFQLVRRPERIRQINLARKLLTFDTCHCSLCLVSAPGLFNAAAIDISDVAPLIRRSASTGTKSAANAAALPDTTALGATPPFPARLSAYATFRFPSFTPHALTTARAFMVQHEMASRSSSVTIAMMPTVRSLSSAYQSLPNACQNYEMPTKPPQF